MVTADPLTHAANKAAWVNYALEKLATQEKLSSKLVSSYPYRRKKNHPKVVAALPDQFVNAHVSRVIP